MKKILFIALFLASSLFANSIQWIEYDKALETAQKQDKIIMVMLGRASCSACKYMKTVVFENESVIEKLNEKYLSVYIELDFDDTPNNLTYIGTPTFHFLDKNEKALKRIDGGKTVPSFMRALQTLD